jgi:hypothetical protein
LTELRDLDAVVAATYVATNEYRVHIQNYLRQHCGVIGQNLLIKHRGEASPQKNYLSPPPAKLPGAEDAPNTNLARDFRKIKKIGQRISSQAKKLGISLIKPPKI